VRYVIDTCVVNALVDGRIALNDLPSDGDFVVTHVQHDEIAATRNRDRRQSLLTTFDEVVEVMLPTESAIVGVSRVGGCRVSDGSLYNSLLAALDNLNGGKANNVQDALIAEVAVANGFVLITGDYHLQQAALQHHCDVMYVPRHPQSG